VLWIKIWICTALLFLFWIRIENADRDTDPGVRRLQINLISGLSKGLFYLCRYLSFMTFYIKKYILHVKVYLFVTAKSDRDPDPYWGKSWIRISTESNADPQHWFKPYQNVPGQRGLKHLGKQRFFIFHPISRHQQEKVHKIFFHFQILSKKLSAFLKRSVPTGAMDQVRINRRNTKVPQKPIRNLS